MAARYMTAQDAVSKLKYVTSASECWLPNQFDGESLLSTPPPLDLEASCSNLEAGCSSPIIRHDTARAAYYAKGGLTCKQAKLQHLPHQARCHSIVGGRSQAPQSWVCGRAVPCALQATANYTRPDCGAQARVGGDVLRVSRVHVQCSGCTCALRSGLHAG